MKIKPINPHEKIVWSDWPGQILYPIVIEGCNFRCPHCFTPSLVLPERYTENEVTQGQLTEVLRNLDKKWYDGVLVTGGEPTIYKELPDLLKTIKNFDLKIRLFTNGSNPKMLQELVEKNLVDSIAMDVKNTREKYNETTGVSVNIQDIEESMRITSKTKDYEFRTVLNKKFHMRDDAEKIADWIHNIIRKKPNYVIRNFKPHLEYISSFPGEPFSLQEFEDIQKNLNNYLVKLE